MRFENSFSIRSSQSSEQPLLDDFDSKEVNLRPQGSNSSSSSSSSSSLDLLPLQMVEGKRRSNSIIRRLRRKPSHVAISTFCSLAFVLALLYVRVSFHPQPSYILLSRSQYHATLLKSIQSSFPKPMQKELESQLKVSTNPNALSSHLSSTATFSYSPRNTLPRTLWQTDKSYPPNIPEVTELRESWEKAGVDQTIFLDDDEAMNTMKNCFSNSSEVFQAYESLPAPVLKADMLRYSLLLAKGGIYSDIDTKAVMPIEAWKTGSRLWIGQGRTPIRLPDVNRSSTEAESRELSQVPPVRMIIGIEATNIDWDTPANFLRWAHLKIRLRHRKVQFVQWTIQASAFHPIFLDTLRRILDTNQVAKGLLMEREIKIKRAESSGNFRELENLKRKGYPWDGVKGKEFEITGVEEFTGPGTWSDAVISYLQAVSDITVEDLIQLRHSDPLQVGDVLILPRVGFNPYSFSTKKDFSGSATRVGHLFRGSWK